MLTGLKVPSVVVADQPQKLETISIFSPPGVLDNWNGFKNQSQFMENQALRVLSYFQVIEMIQMQFFCQWSLHL